MRATHTPDHGWEELEARADAVAVLALRASVGTLTNVARSGSHSSAKGR